MSFSPGTNWLARELGAIRLIWKLSFNMQFIQISYENAMNLSQLRFASAIAAKGSFTAAAAQCCVTQPTLSNGISLLETELGERLFVRTTRKVSLTAFGQHILPCINDVLGAQTNLLHQAQIFLKPEKRLIRIGISPLINANLLGLMIEAFHLRNPDIDVVLREMNMADLDRLLDAGLLDFVFGVTYALKKTCHATALYEEPLLFIPRGGVWRGNLPPYSVKLGEIADEVFVMVPDACGLSRATHSLFRSQRRRLKEYSGEAMSYQVLEEWASLGIGSAILPRSKITSSKRPSYPIADKTGREVTIGYEAVWSRTAVQSPHLLEFANHLRNVVPGIVSGLQQDTNQVRAHKRRNKIRPV